ncbi:hypothetical protein QUF72_08985 [Desulfobacterales bacterium HSG2]|nr:hypothetical protein [Desulfobacterales bacterium HSG2]
MGKKKKKKKKPQKGPQLHNLTVDQLINTGKQSIEAGKPRDAISIFKFAGKKHGQSDEINTLLFRSYLMREAQLREKNLIAEADAVKKQAQDHMPWVDQLSEDDMMAYISTCSNKEAFDIYAGYSSANDRSPRAEQFLANRLFKSDNWKLSDKLNESLPIRRDAAPMQKAIPLMNAGNWEDALEVLLPISRTSPFAPIRMFCRAMVSFYKGDDQDMCRALSMIPDDFPLIGVARSLESTVGNNGSNNRRRKAGKRLECLWDGPVNMEEDIRDLLYDLEHKRFHEAEHSISSLSNAIYPEDPMAVRSFMLESIWNMTFQYKIEDYEFRNMVTDLLPQPHGDMLLTKTRLLRFHTPMTTTGQYLSLLENEFPDPETRKIAHAFILMHTVSNMLKIKFNPAKEKKAIQKYKTLLGIHHEDTEMILTDMVTEAMRLDPLSRNCYEILVELPRKSRPAKNAVEASLTDMCSHFPDDPWPCLELATLFYEKNAFRKAENILEEAMKRAPHDSRVIDRHIIALLISAEKNIQRKKFHLVERDIKKAEKFESRKVCPFVIEKRIVFQIVNCQNDLKADAKDEADQLSLFKGQKGLKAIIRDEIKSLPLFDRLRILAILITDMKHRKIDEKKYILNELEKVFDKELKYDKDLSSSEVVRLLTPLEKDYTALLSHREIAPIFLKKRKDILKGVDDTEIIPVFDLIFAPEWFGLIKKEVKRRVKKAKKKERLFMEFYRVTIQHIKGEELDPDLFEDIIEEAPKSMFEELRAVSRRLSKHATGSLKKALEVFDFDILDDMPFFGGFPGDDIDDFFPDDIDDFFPHEDERGLEKLIDTLRELESDPDMAESGTLEDRLVDELVESFEVFVDSLALRDAPAFIINELREIIRADPTARRDFDLMAELIDHADAVGRLSREGRIILFGSRGKSGGRRKRKN